MAAALHPRHRHSTAWLRASACLLGGVVLFVTSRTATRPLPWRDTWPPTAESDAFPYDCGAHGSNTSLLLSVLGDDDGGGAAAAAVRPRRLPPRTRTRSRQPMPAWVGDACPEVVAHFDAFPYFPAFHGVLPVSTSAYAATGVCTLKVLSQVVSAAGMGPPMLHAGAHLGALVHGGPIPWDDDIDVAMPWEDRDRILAACKAARHAVHPRVTLGCQLWRNAIKVYVRPRGANAWNGTQQHSAQTAHAAGAFTHSQQSPGGYWTPYVDLFLYRVDNGTGRVSEVAPRSGAPLVMSFPAGHVFPLQRYYFAGLFVQGPPPVLATARYDLRTCVSGRYNHRLERGTPREVRTLRLDCCALARAGFPFAVHRGDRSVLVGGRRGRSRLVLRERG